MTGPEAAAVRYATAGLPVFPVRGKLPLTAHGLHDATTDPVQIASWYERWPEAGVAIVTGGSQHLCVLDVDGEQGRASLAWLESRYGALPRTRAARTGSGGLHLLYAFPESVQPRNSSGLLGPGLDTRGEGGYIVAPPSVHPNGSPYAWEDASEVASAPRWLVELFRAREERSRGRPAAEPAHERYVAAAIEAEVARVAQAQEGQRNECLNVAAYSLGQLVGAGLLRRAEAEAELRSAAERCGLPHGEAERTLRSGLEAGLLEPRQVELLAPEPVPLRRPAAGTEPEQAPELPPPEADTLAEFIAVEEAGVQAILGTQEAALVPEGGDVMVYGDGGAGKTTLCVDMAFHLATGQPWLGIEVPRPVRVLLVENEGPRPLYRAKLRRKAEAWAGGSVGDRLLVWRWPWAAATFGTEAGREELAALLREREVDVCVVGPVTRAGMDEAGTLQEVRDFALLVAWVRTRSGRAITFVLVHHEGKAGTVSGAWEGAGDTLLHVSAQGHGSTRLHVQKARWSSEHQGRTLYLTWAEGESYTVAERPEELSDDDLAEAILAAVRQHPGLGWGRLEQHISGRSKAGITEARNALLVSGRLVNVVGGQVLHELRQGVAAALYDASDPALRQLPPELGEVQGKLLDGWEEER